MKHSRQPGCDCWRKKPREIFEEQNSCHANFNAELFIKIISLMLTLASTWRVVKSQKKSLSKMQFRWEKIFCGLFIENLWIRKKIQRIVRFNEGKENFHQVNLRYSEIFSTLFNFENFLCCYLLWSFVRYFWSRFNNICSSE